MKNIFKFALGIGLIVIIIAVFFQTNKSFSSDYNANIYSVNSGFGYEITTHNKILIKQDFIPVIQNKIPFCSEADAQKIANLVIDKLENKESPRITKKELKDNNIVLNCLNKE